MFCTNSVNSYQKMIILNAFPCSSQKRNFINKMLFGKRFAKISNGSLYLQHKRQHKHEQYDNSNYGIKHHISLLFTLCTIFILSISRLTIGHYTITGFVICIRQSISNRGIRCASCAIRETWCAWRSTWCAWRSTW